MNAKPGLIQISVLRERGCGLHILIHLSCTSLSLLSPLPVLAELGQADMITSDERERLNDHCDLVSIQCGKSPQVLSQTADVLSRFQGFEEESRFLAGKLNCLSICWPVYIMYTIYAVYTVYIMYVVQWRLLYNRHYETFMIVVHLT